MKCRFEFMTMTQLGEFFGVSSHQIGKWLVQIGLRTDANKPSREAFDRKYVEAGPSRGQGYNWVWRSEQTIKALRDAGHPLVEELPSSLVHPPSLEGPFMASSRYVINGAGERAVKAGTPEQAEILAKLLSAAHRQGLLARLLGHTEVATVV